jgi:Flp pilus assembly protein TadD
LELNPSDNAMRHNLVRTLLILGEYQQAEGHLEILVQSEPNDPGHQARLALCQWKMGKRDDARKTLDFALQQNPQDPAVKQVEQLIGRE